METSDRPYSSWIIFHGNSHRVLWRCTPKTSDELATELESRSTLLCLSSKLCSGVLCSPSISYISWCSLQRHVVIEINEPGRMNSQDDCPSWHCQHVKITPKRWPWIQACRATWSPFLFPSQPPSRLRLLIATQMTNISRSGMLCKYSRYEHLDIETSKFLSVWCLKIGLKFICQRNWRCQWELCCWLISLT